MQNILGILPNTKTKITNQLLRKWNITLAALYAIQGGAILLLSSPHYLQLTSLFTTTDTLQTRITGEAVMAPAVHQLLTINLVGPVAAFIFVSAILHLLSATIYKNKYENWLKKDISPIRWIEFSLSGGIVLIVISLLAGIYDVASLVMIFGFSVILGLSGFMLEARNQQLKKKPVVKLLDKYVMSIIFVIPWVIIGFYLICTNIFGSGVPSYMYFIYATTLLLFIAIAVNLYLVRSKKHGWNFAYGECWHMVLSLVVQSLLAWQVFIDVLHP